jgi:uncharacterized protein
MSVIVDVRDLVRQPGSSRPLQVSEPIEGLAAGLAMVPQDRPVDAALLMESVVEGILVTGPLSGVMTLECARCLKRFDHEFQVRVQEMFAEGVSPEDDEYPLAEGHVDLEPMMRDAILLSAPYAPLCRPDCQGLCPRCGGDRNLGECTCGPAVDLRWAPLMELNLDMIDDPSKGA